MLLITGVYGRSYCQNRVVAGSLRLQGLALINSKVYRIEPVNCRGNPNWIKIKSKVGWLEGQKILLDYKEMDYQRKTGKID